MPFQQYFSYIMAVSFICNGNRNTTDLLEVTEEHYHIKLYWVHITTEGYQTHRFLWDRILMSRKQKVMTTSFVKKCESQNEWRVKNLPRWVSLLLATFMILGTDGICRYE
jgi:hypothetical protein